MCASPAEDERKTDKETDLETDGRTDGPTDRKKEREEERQTHAVGEKQKQTHGRRQRHPKIMAETGERTARERHSFGYLCVSPHVDNT